MPVEPRYGPTSTLSSHGLGGLGAEVRQKVKTVGTPGGRLPTPKPKVKPADAPVNMMVQAFEYWLATPALGPTVCYYRGELSRDAQNDPAVAELAEVVRGVACMDQVIVSDCGHERGYVEGKRLVELVVMRFGDEQRYIARRRPVAPAEAATA